MTHSIPTGEKAGLAAHAGPFGNCSCASSGVLAFQQSCQVSAEVIAGLRELRRQEAVVAGFRRLQDSVPGETIASLRKFQERAAANHGAEMLAILNRKDDSWKLDLK